MRARGAVGAGTDRLLLVVSVVVEAELQTILFWRSSPQTIEHHAVLNDTSCRTVFNLS